MVFPGSTQRVIYRKNPLTEVICQLRFSTILAIGTDDPTRFQEAVRAEYPVYSLEAPPSPFPAEFAKRLLSTPGGAEFKVHRFATEDGSRAIHLNRDYLAVVENRYERWETFRRHVAYAEQALAEAYRPSYYTRIGLRYVDVISRERLGLRDAQWRDLLKPTFTGLLGEESLASRVESLLVNASMVIEDQVRGGRIRLQHGLAQEGAGAPQVYAIDADFFTEMKSKRDDAFDALDRFNRLSGDLFRWAIEPALASALQPEEVDGKAV